MPSNRHAATYSRSLLATSAATVVPVGTMHAMSNSLLLVHAATRAVNFAVGKVAHRGAVLDVVVALRGIAYLIEVACGILRDVLFALFLFFARAWVFAL